MRSILSKQFLFTFFFLGGVLATNAQTTETFEAQTPYISQFVSNGQTFNLTNAFTVYSSRNGIGYEQSHRFIDNINHPELNQVNSIKTAGGTLFTVKNLWMFLSTDAGNNPSVNGMVIIRGKVGGSVVFTITKTTGFNGSFGVNNGFTYINFATEGGVDNSLQKVDEIEFELAGNFNYIAIDNFTWHTDVVLPITLAKFDAVWQDGRVALNWQTNSESNTSSFIVERSHDGASYKQIKQLDAKGSVNQSSSYTTFDEKPLPGVNYYRLSSRSLDGRNIILAIKAVRNKNTQTGATVYPNPAIGQAITLQSDESLVAQPFAILDINGKVKKTGFISSGRQVLQLQNFAAGQYFLKLGDGQVIKWIKQ